MKNDTFKKNIIYGIVKLIIFLVLLFICILVTNNIVKRKASYSKYADFFSQKEDFDVLFFGSSHTYNEIYSMDLWKNYGIISYNMGTPSERLPTSYYNIQLALKHTNPKLIVVDAYSVMKDKKINEKKEKLHVTLDAYPISKIKYDAIKDLFDGEDLLENEVEFLFPFSMYHSRWDELAKEDFVQTPNLEKGAKTLREVVTPVQMPEFDDVKPYNDEETVNMKYLRTIIEYCKEKDIDILITYLPHTAAKGFIAQSKYVQEICDEYNVQYVNFLKDMSCISYNTDFNDSNETNSHLNASGARKVTNYLGEYIQNHYDIPDHRNNETFSFWNEDYEEYIDFKIKSLKLQQENLNNYLMLLYDEKDIRYEIKISSEKKIEEDSIFEALLKNLNNNYEIDDEIFKEKNDKTVKITTWDNRNEKPIKEVWF